MNSGIICKNDKTKDLVSLKSNFILKKIISLMKRNKSLEIMKYNKKLQKRLNISINDYRECSELFSKIEIELKIADNGYGKFINIPDNEKEYYHIYFDNSKEEIKRNILKKNENVKMIKIIIDNQVVSFKQLFHKCKCISSINFKKFYRINITDMASMFHNCSSLKELKFSYFNTDNVTNMSNMFSECSSLNELKLSNFNTNNVTDMSAIFNGCRSIKELNLSNFNTNNVKDMNSMFKGCRSIKEFNLSNFNTNNVTNMSSIFSECSSLNELNLSNFNILCINNFFTKLLNFFYL